MAKVKYYYDSKSSISKIKVKNGRNWLYYLVFNSGFVCLSFVVLLNATLRLQRPTLEREIANLKLNYEVLDKK
jgi:hypothetical protein